MSLVGQSLGAVQRVMDQVGDWGGVASLVGNGQIEFELLEPV